MLELVINEGLKMKVENKSNISYKSLYAPKDVIDHLEFIKVKGDLKKLSNFQDIYVNKKTDKTDSVEKFFVTVIRKFGLKKITKYKKTSKLEGANLLRAVSKASDELDEMENLFPADDFFNDFLDILKGFGKK